MSEKALSFSKEQWFDMSRIALILVAIAAVVALMLSAVNEICAPRIAAQKEQAVKDAMSLVLPAEDYSKIDNLSELCADPIVTEAYTALNGSDVAGYCVKVAPLGFGGAIEMVVGIDAEDKVTRVHIISMAETPGLGTKTNDAAFLDQFGGKVAGVTATGSTEPKENEISAIAGATVSSKAVTSGVSSALTAAELIKGAANNG